MTRQITITSFIRALEYAFQDQGIHIQADFRLRTPHAALVTLLREAYRQGGSVPLQSILETFNIPHLGTLLNEVSIAEGREAARQLAALICYAQEIGLLLPGSQPGKVARRRLSLQAKHRLLVLFGTFILAASTGQYLYRAQSGEPRLADITPFVSFLTACLGCWNWMAQNHKD